MALLDQMQTDGITPLAVSQRRQLAADGHVRHAQPADQRLRLPRLADGRPGELDRRPGQGRCSRPGRSSSPTTSPTPMAARGRTRRPGSPTATRGCCCSARSSLSNFDPEAQQDIIDDIDFFAFPAINDEHGQDAVEAPIDGFMMAAEPANEEGAKAAAHRPGHGRGDRRLPRASTRRCVAANSEADTSGYYGVAAEDRSSSSARRRTSPSSSIATPIPTSRPTSSAPPSPTSSPIRARSTRSSAPSRSRSRRTPSSELNAADDRSGSPGDRPEAAGRRA